MKNLVKFTVVSFLLWWPQIVSAQKCKHDYPTGKHLVNVDEMGHNVAMEGYDLLTFFTGEYQKGQANFASVHEGINYYFISEANKKAFDQNPKMYLPQYGGFCAVAASFGHAAELETYEYHEVIDDKLYFNKNKKANALWKKGPPRQAIAKADNNWNCIVTDLGLNINEPYIEPVEIK